MKTLSAALLWCSSGHRWPHNSLPTSKQTFKHSFWEWFFCFVTSLCVWSVHTKRMHKEGRWGQPTSPLFATCERGSKLIGCLCVCFKIWSKYFTCFLIQDTIFLSLSLFSFLFFSLSSLLQTKYSVINPTFYLFFSRLQKKAKDTRTQKTTRTHNILLLSHSKVHMFVIVCFGSFILVQGLEVARRQATFATRRW